MLTRCWAESPADLGRRALTFEANHGYHGEAQQFSQTMTNSDSKRMFIQSNCLFRCTGENRSIDSQSVSIFYNTHYFRILGEPLGPGGIFENNYRKSNAVTPSSTLANRNGHVQAGDGGGGPVQTGW